MPLILSERPPSITLRAPCGEDGVAVRRLIENSGALDANSLYCTLLQCTHFAQTCVLAEREGQILGWLSGYIPPQQPDAFFVWQICTAPAARGAGLAQQMILTALQRPVCRGVAWVECTITKPNAPSWALFDSLARKLAAPVKSQLLFERERHLGGAHDSEMRVRIGPFSPKD